MLWQGTYAALALDRQRELLQNAEARRLVRGTIVDTPRYREWLARQLVILALRLAPSVGGLPVNGATAATVNPVLVPSTQHVMRRG